MNKTVRLIACTAMAAALAFAQGRMPGHGHGRGEPGAGFDPAKMIEMRVDRLEKLLTLTADQKAKATQIFTAAQTARGDVRTQMQTARESLAAAVKANNTAAIDQAARDIGAVTTQTIAIESKAQAAFYALLTAEQKTRLDALRPGRGPMGFGPQGMLDPIDGMPGPPGPGCPGCGR
jgi:Spy/CpxP family protein refolding chaperone